jgi:Fic family protein
MHTGNLQLAVRARLLLRNRNAFRKRDRRSRPGLDAAAFALRRINWIHPFKNGNGRTARSFSYCCLCARLGVVLPGAPTVIDQIMTTRPEYEAAIRVGDKAAASGGRDLSAMRAYLDKLLQIQIASVP